PRSGRLRLGARVMPLTPADRWLLRIGLAMPLAGLVFFFVAPMATIVWRSIVEDGGTIGWGNYVALWHTPGVWRALAHSLVLGAATTAICTLLGVVLAYGLERTAMP